MGAALTVAATLATAPLMAFHFERVSLAALPANLVALPAIAPVMWIGMLSAAAGAGVDRARRAAERAERLLPRLRRRRRALGRAAARRGRGGRGSIGPVQLALAYAALAGVARRGMARCGPLAPARPRALGACARRCVAAGCRGCCSRRRTPRRPAQFTVTFLDVGQGDATLIQAPGGVAVLVDGGPPEADVASKLRARGVRALDAGGAHACAGGPPGRPRGGAGALPGRRAARRRPRRATGPPPAHRGARPGARRCACVPAAAGQRFRLGPALRLDVLAPAIGARRPRTASTRTCAPSCCTVSYRGLDVLLPADAESEVTAALALPPGRGAEGRPPRQRRRGPAGAARAAAPGGGGDRGGRRQPLRAPAPGDARGAARRRCRGCYRTDRDGDVTLTAGPARPGDRALSGDLDSLRMADPKPAYLVQGDDEVKIDGWRRRVRRARAPRIRRRRSRCSRTRRPRTRSRRRVRMTLAIGRRWMLVEGVERWKEKDVKPVAEALDGLPAGHDRGPDRHRARSSATRAGPAPAKLVKAVEKCRRRGHDLQGADAVAVRALGGRAGREARAVDAPEAAQALVDRVGEDDKRRLHERRLMRELEKLAIYAPEDGARRRRDGGGADRLGCRGARLRARRRAGRRRHARARSRSRRTCATAART